MQEVDNCFYIYRWWRTERAYFPRSNIVRKNRHISSFIMVKRHLLAAAIPPLAAESPQESQKSDHSPQKIIWGAIIIVIFSVLVCVSLLFFVWKKVLPVWKLKRARKGNLKAENLMLRCFQLHELERATKNFSDDCLLGSGGFGNVYQGAFDSEGILAIKRAHAASYQSVEEFRNEVRLLSKVKHRNLVGLVGFCEEAGAKGAKALVYEYVPNGSLLDYIMGKGGRSLTWKQRVDIAIGAAKGIAYLHDGVKPSIIHRDIKPSNILLGDGFEAKVSDFGLVKMGPIGDQSHVSSQIKGTPGYLDPAYCTSYHLTVDTTRSQNNFHIIEWSRRSIESGNIEEILDTNLLTEPCNMEVMLKMGQLGLRCVVKTPKDRPTMTQVWQQLEEAVSEADNFIGRGSRIERETLRSSLDRDYSSQSFVSIDGVGFQRFRIEMDSSQSFQSSSLRRFEIDSIIGIDVDDKNNLRGIREETSREEDR
ncbi:hypothetical protein Ddye_009976 [Dipteronia dyeriana]|uniref:Protein kinase domain-containing protein n=1 Tax=Dipteronia dyeriana TaxID=168575 RepID=A0AAD9XCG6_9ROSI|nr:hypothetical protein Ddye_009976 [Dipteronia dyeriana]